MISLELTQHKIKTATLKKRAHVSESGLKEKNLLLFLEVQLNITKIIVVC